MDFRRILITGGAGFVGTNLAVFLKRAFPAISVVALDSLKRRGSELNLPYLKAHGVTFLHGDVRCREDIESCPPFDLLIDCSAEPSVQAGTEGFPLPVVRSNLDGTIHCMEVARRNDAALIFMSTSRVYPIEPINALRYDEQDMRYCWTAEESMPGYSAKGISEDFSLNGARSLYGATKLACELLLKEYAYSYNMPVMINRCGVLTGPHQMGKVDQGVVSLWVARHLYGSSLRYVGFGGQGKQVRDVLHVEDLFELLIRQMENLSLWDSRIYNVGGGKEISTSLRELTVLCQEVTGRYIDVRSESKTASTDIRIYLTDCTRVSRDFQWRPRKTVEVCVRDTFNWMHQHQSQLRPVLA